jgi:hypothetical protein
MIATTRNTGSQRSTESRKLQAFALIVLLSPLVSGARAEFKLPYGVAARHGCTGVGHGGAAFRTDDWLR